MSRMIAFILSLIGAAATAAEPMNRPNVLVVLVDDFGWGDPSCYGNTTVKTPHMDRLANEAIRFTQGYVRSSISRLPRWQWIHPFGIYGDGLTHRQIDTFNRCHRSSARRR